MQGDEGSSNEFDQLFQTVQLVERMLANALSCIQISLPQARAILIMSAAEGPMMMSSLAGALQQEAQSVTSLMDRLDRADLAKRQKTNSRDRRVIYVGLTKAGKTKAKEVAAVFERVRNEFRDKGNISARDRELLSQLLDRIGRYCEFVLASQRVQKTRSS